MTMKSARTALRLASLFEQRLLTAGRIHHATTAVRAAASSTRVVIPSHHRRRRHREVPSFSSLAVEYDDDDDDDDYIDKHCTTCTCDSTHTHLHSRKQHNIVTPSILPPPSWQHQQPSLHASSQSKPHDNDDNAQQTTALETSTVTANCDHPTAPHDHSHSHHHANEPLPPPLEPPKYSVRRRVLPDRCLALGSVKGKQLLLDCLSQATAASYLPLTEHFSNQSDPAYCGVTTLLVVLNALAVDPGVRWKGGWRYFGNEDVLLQKCCLQAERIRRVGISMEEFAQLGSCQGLQVTMKRAEQQLFDNDETDNDTETEETDETTTPELLAAIDEFRNDVISLLQEAPETDNDELDLNNTIPHPAGILVTSFSRAALGQTGDGHFSPLAAYHAATDQVLVLDVARFKYQPYWVSVKDLYMAMTKRDTAATGRPRGWFLLSPPAVSASYKGMDITSEERRPAGLVPALGHGPASLCPVHPIKVDYCSVNNNNNHNHNNHAARGRAYVVSNNQSTH